eukprot:SAG22_NODE_388_length_11295_cov_14.512594_2_plen_224_part_00
MLCAAFTPAGNVVTGGPNGKITVYGGDTGAEALVEVDAHGIGAMGGLDTDGMKPDAVRRQAVNACPSSCCCAALAAAVRGRALQRTADRLVCCHIVLTADSFCSNNRAGRFCVAGLPGLQQLAKLQFEKMACRCLQFRPGDSTLLSGGADGTIKVWTIHPEYLGETTVLSFKGSDHCLSFCFSAFPCGSTALTSDTCCNQALPTSCRSARPAGARRTGGRGTV